MSLRGVRVAVVGGGLAGLVAARELSRLQAAVHLLEARPRLGGRVWTVRDEGFSSEPVELGGEFIDQDHAAVRALARELGLELRRVVRGGLGIALDIGGRLRLHSGLTTLWQRFRRALRPEAAALEAAAGDWSSTIAAAIASRSLDELLRARGAPDDLLAMASALRGFFAADSDALSALVGVELSMQPVDPSHVPMSRVKGGNDLLVNALARTRNVIYTLQRTVKRIQQDADEVRLTVVEPHGQLEVVRADYAVVTVPPVIFRSWTFSPPLPSAQQRAIESLSQGFATKALLRFDTRWWRKAGRPRAFGTNLPIGAVWESTEAARGPAILTLLAGGRASEELQAILEEEGPDGVARRLAWLGTPGPVREFRSMTWERDPRSRGGYAFFGKSFDPALRPQLARASGRVFFAGEHTSRQHQGFMNGAVESGQRVAREIVTIHRLARETRPDQPDRPAPPD